MNLLNIETQTNELASNNNINIWINNFPNTNVRTPIRPITNYNGVESYDINILMCHVYASPSHLIQINLILWITFYQPINFICFFKI